LHGNGLLHSYHSLADSHVEEMLAEMARKVGHSGDVQLVGFMPEAESLCCASHSPPLAIHQKSNR